MPWNVGAPKDDGFYMTEVSTGESKLWLSLNAILDTVGDRLGFEEEVGGGYFGFHVKWNPQGTRIAVIIRYTGRSGSAKRQAAMLTCDPQGNQLDVALDVPNWTGHHHNWCNDGESLIMNRKVDGILRFTRFGFDGSGFDVFGPEVIGSGHPTLARDMKHVLTDVKPWQAPAVDDGTVPLVGLIVRQAASLNWYVFTLISLIVRLKASYVWTYIHSGIEVDVLSSSMHVPMEREEFISQICLIFLTNNQILPAVLFLLIASISLLSKY